jgi:hypothetical protein
MQMQAMAETSRQSAEALVHEELALHRRLCRRDESALLEYLDRVGHVVYCTALLLGEDEAAAEEMTERLFVELWRRPEGFSPERGPVALQLLALLTAGQANAHVSRRVLPDAIRSSNGPCGSQVGGREDSIAAPADSV